MTVIISRSKKHVYLGRLITATTSKLQALLGVKHHAAALIFQISKLDNLYDDLTHIDFPADTLDKLANERATIRSLATASLLIKDGIEVQLKQAIADLNEHEGELDKAEQSYQKRIKKEQKTTSLPEEVERKELLAKIEKQLKD